MNSTTRQALLGRLAEHPNYSPPPGALLGATGEPYPKPSLWFGHAPDDAPLPVALLTLDDERPLLAHSGPLGLAEATLALDIWGPSDTIVLLLRDVARAQLHGWAGAVSAPDGQGGTATAQITHCIHSSSSEDFDAVNNLAHARAEFSLGYRVG